MEFTKEGLSYHYLNLVIDLSFAENRVKVLVAQSCPTLYDPIDCCPTDSSVHGILLARIGVGFHSLLQGIFPTQGSNLGLLHCRQILYHLSHQGSPKIGYPDTIYFLKFYNVYHYEIFLPPKMNLNRTDQGSQVIEDQVNWHHGKQIEKSRNLKDNWPSFLRKLTVGLRNEEEDCISNYLELRTRLFWVLFLKYPWGRKQHVVLVSETLVCSSGHVRLTMGGWDWFRKWLCWPCTRMFWQCQLAMKVSQSLLSFSEFILLTCNKEFVDWEQFSGW